jgi:hypothetical protein
LGKRNEKAYVARVEDWGNMLWQVEFPIGGYEPKVIFTNRNKDTYVACDSIDPASPNSRILLTKLDSVGGVIWSKILSIDSKRHLYNPKFVSRSTDQEFSLIFNDYNTSTDVASIIALVFDSNGDISESKILSSTDNIEMYDVWHRNNGTAKIYGKIDQVGGIGNNQGLTFAYSESTNDTVYEIRTISNSNGNNSMILDVTSRFEPIIVDSINKTIVKLDSDDKPVWAREFNSDVQVNSIVYGTTTSSDIFVTYTKASVPHILKMDVSGNVLGVKSLPNFKSITTHKSYYTYSNSMFLGTYNTEFGGDDFYFGNVESLFNSSYCYSTNSSELFTNVTYNHDSVSVSFSNVTILETARNTTSQSVTLSIANMCDTCEVEEDCNFINVYGDDQNNTLSASYYDANWNGYVWAGKRNGNFMVARLTDNGSIIWQKEIARQHNPKSVLTTTGGRILIACDTSYQTTTIGDIYLYCLDSLGNFLWAKSYDGGLRDTRVSLLRNNNDFLLSYSNAIQSSLENFTTMTIDENGNTLWSKEISVSGDLQFYDFLETYDIQGNQDGFIFNGGRHVPSSSGGRFAAILKLDLNGNVVFDEIYGDLNNTVNFVEFYKTYRTPDNGFIVVGAQSAATSPQYDFYIKKFDNNLNEIWGTAFQTNSNSGSGGLNGLVVDLFGSIYVSYVENGIAKVTKLNPNGIDIWTKEFTNFSSVIIESNKGALVNELIIRGTYNTQYGGNDIFYATFDTSLVSCITVNSNRTAINDVQLDQLNLSFTSSNYLPTITNIIEDPIEINMSQTGLCPVLDTSECNLTADFEFDVDCQNQSVSFTNLSVDSIHNIVSYKWDFGDGTYSSDTNVVHFYQTSGPFSVSLVIANDACPACTDTITYNVDLLGNCCLDTCTTCLIPVEGETYDLTVDVKDIYFLPNNVQGDTDTAYVTVRFPKTDSTAGPFKPINYGISNNTISGQFIYPVGIGADALEVTFHFRSKGVRFSDLRLVSTSGGPTYIYDRTIHRFREE